jgi:hypothetical protein
MEEEITELLVCRKVPDIGISSGGGSSTCLSGCMSDVPEQKRAANIAESGGYARGNGRGGRGRLWSGSM